jgi:hydroxymethylpyrimidine kinase/phosphomethylpyrimidine kinase
MLKAAAAILELGPRAVLIKGGHLDGPGADDLFVDGARSEWLEGKRIDTRDTHGTGCVLSAAIAAHLAKGADVLQAARLGKAFVTEAIRHAVRVGGGIGPVDPAWATTIAER